MKMIKSDENWACYWENVDFQLFHVLIYYLLTYEFKNAFVKNLQTKYMLVVHFNCTIFCKQFT